MKHCHILNVGYPKCGTTWLWDTLVENQSIQGNHIKENHSLCTGVTVDDYCQQYKENTTANFCPNNMILDRYVIEQLSKQPQISASIILREPVALIWSMYNFRNVTHVDFATYCYQLYDAKWFTHMSLVIDRWKEYFLDRFHIFWYDDLKSNNLEFYSNYCQIMGLDPGSRQMLQSVNTTNYASAMPDIDRDLVELLTDEFKKVKHT